MSATEIKVVRFKLHYTVYNAGETAGFPPDEAADLVDRGIADAVEPQSKSKRGGEDK